MAVSDVQVRELFWSHHAVEREDEMVQQGLQRWEVDRALDDPEVSWSTFGYKGVRETTRQAGRVAVIVAHDDDCDVVVTVLWRTDKRYQRR